METTANKLAQIARENQKQIKRNSFAEKIKWESHQYVRYVKQRCETLALKGYGSVRITIDKTVDIFQTDEHRNSCYSFDFVCTLLKREGFKFGKYITDHYDAMSLDLIWEETLSKAPNSERIGISWK